ncbi:hypothetical protein NUW58_g7122 [Xylaria curta]|uniref:Uncharacterized protein n=1 Tax=Xylaria curta TaxID=42375 RepID=A0ACC1NMK6_9PEZI|nr:hypothetical protein NUW58_g7122 [Xylaria curta]
MEDSGGAPDGGDSSSEPSRSGGRPEVVVISEHGDVVPRCHIPELEGHDPVRPEGCSGAGPAETRGAASAAALPKARVRLAFRVDLTVLKRQSKYFDKLFGDAHFKEANDIADAFAALQLKNVTPAHADVADLPWIAIHDDDEATSYAYREMVFADLLRIVHGQDAKTSQPQMSFVTTLAVLADRFDCATVVSKYVATGLKFKWPVTSRGKPARDDGAGFSGMSRANENILRQKILVSWLLNQQPKFMLATRELIMNGSCQWSSFSSEEDDTTSATWWYLQDGLERESRPFSTSWSVINTIYTFFLRTA